MENCELHNNKIRVNSIFLKNITPKTLILFFFFLSLSTWRDVLNLM